MTIQANEQATEQVIKQSGVQTGEHSRHAPQSDDTPIIDTRDLWRIYKLGSQEIPALRGIDMTIGSGLALLVFFAIALQCVSTLAILSKESASSSLAVKMFVGYFLFAYTAAVAVYQLAQWLA